MRPNASAIECVNSLLLGRYAPWGKESLEKIGQRFPLPSLTMIGGNRCRAAKRERERERERERWVLVLLGLGLVLVLGGVSSRNNNKLFTPSETLCLAVKVGRSVFGTKGLVQREL